MIKSVLLVRPPARLSIDFGGSFKKDYGGHELELGLLCIASFLERQGIHVSFLDMTLHDDAEKRLVDTLQHSNFDFIGMTAYTNSITTANRIAGLIRQYSKAKIVVGGAHASALPVETLEMFKNFDYLIYGEGERSFTDLVIGKDISDIKGLLWREGGTIRQNPPVESMDDLDSLPFPARHLVDVSKYIPIPSNYYQLPSTGILSSRGCPYQCTYCGRSGARFKNTVKFRSIANVIEEIKSCIRDFGIYDFRFYDDVFTTPKTRIMEFCEQLLKEDIKITWNCYARVDTIDREMLLAMRKAGCRNIKYGVDFGTQKWHTQARKHTTLKQAEEAIDLTKKIGIAAKASFIIGMPGETEDEINKTINFAIKLNPTYTTFNIFTPLPGSQLFDEAKINKTLLSYDYDEYFDKKGTILKDQLELSILEKSLKKAYKKVYFNPRFFMHRIMHLVRNPCLPEVKMLFKGLAVIIKNKFFFSL
jgi:anaerobic magnesium-protoporphyrin IX monomethyl ester cyclase